MKQLRETRYSKLILITPDVFPVGIYLSYGLNQSEMESEIKKYNIDIEYDHFDTNHLVIDDESSFLIHFANYEDMVPEELLKESTISSVITAQLIKKYLKIKSNEIIPYLSSYLMTEIYKQRPSESRLWEMDGGIGSESNRSSRKGNVSELREGSGTLNRSLPKVENLTLDQSEVVNSLTLDLNEDSIKKFIEYLKYLKGDEQDTEDKD